MKKICVVTGSRADYDLLRWVMQSINDSQHLELQIIVTGSHLSPEFGLTYKNIESDGFLINQKVELLLSSDTSVGISKSIGIGVCGFADALENLKPDAMLILGDRYEIFAAAIASMVACLPIIHLHGGEVTYGAIDDAIRHSITKMSHVHFVAAEEYRHRVIQLGENKKHVYLVGGLGVDAMKRYKPMTKSDLEESLGLRFQKRNLLVTFHPPTLEKGSAVIQMTELLESLELLEDTTTIFTIPNPDMESREIINMLHAYAKKHSNTSKVFSSLGQLRYFSCMKYVDAVLGNSSSGLLEAPSMGIGTINIGSRQDGRLKASSVIDCDANKESITSSLKLLYSHEFQSNLNSIKNPYGDGGAVEKIVKTLEEIDLSNLVVKKFNDVQNNIFRCRKCAQR